jgi:putative copper resistance protein D
VIVFDPQGIALVALLIALYARAVTVLGRRGYRVPAGQQALWYTGTALIAIALLGPPDTLSDDLLSAHMGQHLLIADLSAPLLLAGARTPVLQFLLPPPILVPLARTDWLRRLFRFVRRPRVALPLWILTLYCWHLPFAFQGALEHPAVHALQHQMFFLTSLLVWWAIIEPKRRRIPVGMSKAGDVIGMRLAGMFLGITFILLHTQAYPWYGHRAELHGISTLTDQQIGGGLMLVTDLLVMLCALGFFLWRAAADDDRAETAKQAAAAQAS